MADAVATRRREAITLKDGTSVVVEEWSWAKLQEMLPKFAEGGGNFPMICEHSVRQEDREKIAGLGAFDVSKVMLAVARVNDLEELLKNLSTLGGMTNPPAEGKKLPTA